MNETVFLQVQTIFRSFFRNQNLDLAGTTTTEDITAWDSLNHLALMNEIENHFKIQFSLNEIIGFKNVGEMVDCIANKL